MFVYVGKNFTATLTGRRIVEVNCEKCRTQFFYELLRQATGTASAPYYIGQDSAARRAENTAKKNLDKKLTRESDLVACPKCKWVNQELINGYRGMRYRWVTVVSTLLAIVAWVAALIYLNDNFETRTNDFLTNAGLSLIPTLAVIVTGYGVQRWLRGLINPNREFPGPPRLPPGMPKAWTTAEMAIPADLPVELSHRLDPADDPFPGWAMFRTGHLVIPPQCCECLGPPDTLYASPFKVSENDNAMPAPLCAACASRLKGKWWLHALYTFAAIAAIAAVAYLALPADDVGRAIMATIIMIFGVAIGLAVVPALTTRPYRLRTVDGARGLFRVRYRNQQYTDLVRQACAEHEQASFPRIEVPLEPMPED